ncbi:MAG: YciI family protein [Saprospiraceae bacterium]
MKNLFLLILPFLFFACENKPQQSINQASIESSNNPTPDTDHVLLPYPDSLFETFEMPEGEITYVMKKYFIAFLKEGPKRNQSKEEADKIQAAHMAELGKVANEKIACMIGPFGQDAESDIQGIIVFSVPNKKEAERLAALDPAVQSGRLLIEVHPWWAAKGSKLF